MSGNKDSLPEASVETPPNEVMFTFYIKDMDPELQLMDLLRQVFQTFTYEAQQIAGTAFVDVEAANRAMLWFIAWAQSRINEALDGEDHRLHHSED